MSPNIRLKIPLPLHSQGEENHINESYRNHDAYCYNFLHNLTYRVQNSLPHKMNSICAEFMYIQYFRLMK